MSVTIHGVKGYNYQYKLTVLFGLLQNLSKDEKLFAEMAGSEDITFIDGGNNIIEIQTKMEKKDLDLSLLVEWLFHFKEYDDSNCLLTRITSGESRCLFITRSRCNDDTRFLLNDFPQTKRKNLKPTRELINKIKTAISKISFKETDLGKKRKVSSDKISREITDIEITHLINNTIVWEQLDDDKIDDEVLRILNKKLSIAESQCEILYLKLLKIVENGKDTKENLIPAFKSSISKLQVNKYPIHEFYISRSQEVNLEELLEKGNILLLTGVSQCGKTELAKKIANKYIEKGFNKIRSSSELSIENFFNQNPSESKIAILEDPFGHVKPNKEAAEIKRRIIDLSNSLPLHHKIIITSRIEIINEVFPSSFFNEFPSINVTEDDSKEIMNFWNEFSRKFNVDKQVEILVRDFIKKERQDQLQIGQLEYLAKYNSESLRGKSVSELISIARHNSNDVANNLAEENRERANVLGILSICCSNLISVNKIDLSYVLSKDKNEYTVFEKDFRLSILRDKTKYPKYASPEKISKKVKSYLYYFEERGFIRLTNDMIIFSHPNYFEAGRILFFRKSVNEQKKNLKYLKKAIVSINPVTALFACKELYPIYKKIDLSLQTDVREFMLVANRSIYPSVEDYASINLINVLGDFEKVKEKEKIVEIIDRGSTSSGSIKWHKNKVPYISKEGVFLPDLKNIPQVEVIDGITEKILNGEYVKIKEAWDYVNFYKWKSFSRQIFKIESGIISSLLAYDEVFIRKQVAKIFFCAKIEKDEIFLIDRILGDNHPTVVFYGIWGAFLFWNKQDREVKDYLFKFFKNLFARQEIAIRSKDFLLNFSIDYSGECIDWESFSHEEKIELWNIWGEIFPIFSKNLPASVYINVGRFGDTMTTATNFLNHDNGINVFNAWYERIDYKIDNGAQLSDYEMGIIDDLLSFTKDNHFSRNEIFRKVFTHTNSLFLLYSLKIVLPYYEKLHLEEKEIIIQLVKSNRYDICWIHALLLAIYDIPQTLLLIVTNGKDLGLLKPNQILEILPLKLIHDSLKIIYRNPYELGLLFPYNMSGFWKKNINYILFHQIEPFFKLCIEEFVGNNIWGSRTGNYLLWRKICLKTNDLDYLLYLIIYNISSSTIYINGTCQIMTNIKMAYERKGKLNDFTKIISDNIEALQLSHKEDIFKYFDRDYIFYHLYPAIYPDIMALKVLESGAVIAIEPLLDTVESFRFFYTYWLLEHLLEKDQNINPEAKSKILAFPNKISENGKSRQNNIEERYLLQKIEIDNWNLK